ncbi:MAG: hypothetical protein FWF00_04885 [Endomicrobia bacterium]|nr:hypothetical protein [Endomicrobiia bacterium]MCL2507005.1 hypothetical protein [Endomicrobiia bacterium]
MAEILVVSLEKRRETAVKVQEVLTDFGCSIRTRIGLHESNINACSDNGIIILDLVSDTDKNNELMKKLEIISGVKVKFVSI